MTLRRIARAVLPCLALFACRSLPTIVPGMGHRPAKAVPLEGTRGPLSAQRSKAILAELASKAKDSSLFDRHLAIEEAIVGSPLTTGNKVQLLQDGPATYQAMMVAISDARNHINLETYIFDDDVVGVRFADALIAKQRQGVQVNVIRDSAGTVRTPNVFFTRLSEAGVAIVEFNPINPLKKRWEINQRDHRKLLIVDGRVAFLGGINISSVYSGGSFHRRSKKRPGGGPPWRDTDVRLEGPVVAELQELFIETWQKQKGEPLADFDYFPPPRQEGKEVVRAIGSSPDAPYSLIYATLLSAIACAETEIWIANAYFAPDHQLLTALKDAAARGVDVKLLLPSVTDSTLVFHAGRSHYSDLLKHGVELHERRGALLHVKTAVIDGVWSTVGSTNLDWRSFLHNDELNVVVLGTEFGERMRDAFIKDLTQSEVITLKKWEYRTLGSRIKESFASAWEYWL